MCAVYLERCTSLLIAQLAIFKVGGTFLPMETDYPPHRIEYMLKGHYKTK
jgi:non-ribosomal peptide synthetase component F